MLLGVIGLAEGFKNTFSSLFPLTDVLFVMTVRGVLAMIRFR